MADSVADAIKAVADALAGSGEKVWTTGTVVVIAILAFKSPEHLKVFFEHRREKSKVKHEIETKKRRLEEELARRRLRAQSDAAAKGKEKKR